MNESTSDNDLARVEAALNTLLADHDPAIESYEEFRGHQFDHGLAWVHHPEGHGGLGVRAQLQRVVNRRLAEAERALVRERMAWIDRHAFGPMIGLYYGVESDAIARACDALSVALAQMGRWTTEAGWLAGTTPSLAEAVAIPIHIRMAGLERLGFDGALTDEWRAHGVRCRALPGWSAVEWSTEQTDEFVARFEAFRRKRRSRGGDG